MRSYRKGRGGGPRWNPWKRRRPPVGPDVADEDQSGADRHHKSPADHQADVVSGSYLINDIRKDIGDHQIQDGAGELDGEAKDHRRDVGLHIADHIFHGRTSFSGAGAAASAFPFSSIRPRSWSRSSRSSVEKSPVTWSKNCSERPLPWEWISSAGGRARTFLERASFSSSVRIR